MVESTALEMRHTRKGIGGSNPSLSASTIDRMEPEQASIAQAWRTVAHVQHRRGAPFSKNCATRYAIGALCIHIPPAYPATPTTILEINRTEATLGHANQI